MVKQNAKAFSLNAIVDGCLRHEMNFRRNASKAFRPYVMGFVQPWNILENRLT